MKKYTLCTVLFLTVLTMPAHSALKKVAQTGMQFLKVDVGARAAAMGGAFMMVGNDANALFYNPAGIAKMNASFDLLANRTKWIAGISYIAVGCVKNLGRWGSIGISFITSDYGDIYGTRLSNTDKGYEETGNVNVGAYAVGIAYAKQLTDKFTVGGQVKYAYQHLGESLFSNNETIKNQVSGLAYDFGTMFYPGFKSFRLGMSIRNFSPQFKYQQYAFQLPLTFVLGFAMDVLDFAGQHDNSLIVAVDAIHPRDYTERIHVGAEYLFMKMFAFRVGYKFNYDEESFTAGLGFEKKVGGLQIKLGYAYSDLGVFDNVNRISFGCSF
jgi:hypothetical protein